MGAVSRGDVVLAAAAGDYGKPRPWLVVQADKHNSADRPDSILVCPFTSHQETLVYRVLVDLPYGDARRASWVMVDKLMAIKPDYRPSDALKGNRHRPAAKVMITARACAAGQIASILFQ